MENPSNMSSGRLNRGGEGGIGMEDSMLAMLDASEAHDAFDDRIAFLDAVRASSIIQKHRKLPTGKIFRAIFRMLRTGKSLEVIMASYKLLLDLDKHFPRVYSTGNDNSKSSANSPSKLVVAEEAWSPLLVFQDNANSVGEESKKQPDQPLEPSSFHDLIEELAELSSETEFQASNMKALQNMLLFQYLVVVLEGDFLPRNATMNWNMQRESMLNILLGSRKINYKSMMQDCLIVFCQLSQLQNELSNHLEIQKSTESQLSKHFHTALSFALHEVVKNTCVSMDKFFVMIMDLDISRKKADLKGHTTRADGLRKPLMDILLDQLAYSIDTVPVFLKTFSEPKWKLEIVVQYLWKYMTKPSARTRKSNGSPEDATFEVALKCISNKTGTKSITKKIGPDVMQFLLAFGFQARLSILSEGNAEGGVSALADLCQMFISAFESLRSTNESMEIFSIGKEALFTAATIISMKS
ncbi:negative regulator of systemic acquired resistance SNI1 [Arachis stenosperma]|uniref:negative regulator of systemic acquired resistance SNI1 n=1 Tax=Arachis stenosperma TaxID=217475 RepID=UPI0025AD6745|nr:negative regulator of systemic acquired resistance SNI1 [Arachis stenosperma]XP_057748043.1 negative regulator of systemic acquired resistance SNI1 [Arachis stenosperma]